MAECKHPLKKLVYQAEHTGFECGRCHMTIEPWDLVVVIHNQDDESPSPTDRERWRADVLLRVHTTYPYADDEGVISVTDSIIAYATREES